MERIRTVSHASSPHHSEETPVAVSLDRVMDGFVELVKHNPKVWAVYAREDPSGITVWTYVDSTDRNDLSQVYEDEWRLLNMYPKVGFDFNTALVPVGNEQFDDLDDRDGVYLFKR
jgi:hypothetical protein